MRTGVICVMFISALLTAEMIFHLSLLHLTLGEYFIWRQDWVVYGSGLIAVYPQVENHSCVFYNAF